MDAGKPRSSQPRVMLFSPPFVCLSKDGFDLEARLASSSQYKDFQLVGSVDDVIHQAQGSEPVVLLYDARNINPRTASAHIGQIAKQCKQNVQVVPVVNQGDALKYKEFAASLSNVKLACVEDFFEVLSLYTAAVPDRVCERSAIVVVQDKAARQKVVEALGNLDMEVEQIHEPGPAISHVFARKPRVVVMQTPQCRGYLSVLRDAAESIIVTYYDHHSHKDLPSDGDSLLRHTQNEQLRDVEAGAHMTFAYPLSRHLFEAHLRVVLSRKETGGGTELVPADCSQVPQPKIYVFKGPSAVGKSTYIREIVRSLGGTAREVLKATSRPLRPYEKDGRDLIVLAPEIIKKNIEKELYIDVTPSSSGHLYAIDRSLEKYLRQGRDVFIQGHVKDDFSKLEMIFPGSVVQVLLVADEDVLRNRIMHRPDYSEEKARRIALNKGELFAAMCALNTGSHIRYVIDTCRAGLSMAKIEDNGEAINETLRKLINIVEWERHYGGRDYVRSLLDRLTGFGPGDLVRVVAKSALSVDLSGSIPDYKRAGGSILYPRWLESGSRARLVGYEVNGDNCNVYMQTPRALHGPEVLRDLVQTALAPFGRPLWVAQEEDLKNADLKMYGIDDLWSLRYVIRYSLSDRVVGAEHAKFLDGLGDGILGINVCIARKTAKNGVTAL
ncbi:hypothetical protein HY641_04175 [Candidatus Woesearchaeota archaeon]|nr:hypothetical protein [Candidatus Woesearchaeota archaeon]